jgi:DNA-binding IclR family transcriptional regulator
MTTAADTAIPHGAEGSDTCCAVLRLLHRRPEGLALVDIARALQTEVYDVKQALIGLSERGRVRSVGRGTAARWYTTPHAVRARALQS